MPFPKILRWTLLAPLAGFALAMLMPILLSATPSSQILRGVFLILIAAAGLAELFAVPVAIFLLLRRGPYVTVGNVVITLIAAIPLAVVGFIVLVLNFGHFHI